MERLVLCLVCCEKKRARESVCVCVCVRVFCMLSHLTISILAGVHLFFFPAWQDEIAEAAERIRFLLKHAELTNDDVKINTTTVKWPSTVEKFVIGENFNLNGDR